MRETTPKVYLIGYPHLDWPVILDFLNAQEMGVHGEFAADWLSMEKPPSDAESLVEFMGRLCYRSFAPGLNANVKKIREDPKVYIGNVLASKHGSVFEHANLNFVFDNVSRVFTHELVRHRAGVAISQESLRYVRLTDLGFRIPDILEPARDTIVTLVETLEEVQVALADQFGLDDDGVPFHVKKEVTSALRRLAPLGLSTKIGWTANIRTLRHVIAQRTAPGAEEEIRDVFRMVANLCFEKMPFAFQDMIHDTATGAVVFQHEKV